MIKHNEKCKIKFAVTFKKGWRQKVYEIEFKTFEDGINFMEYLQNKYKYSHTVKHFETINLTHQPTLIKRGWAKGLWL